jgi:hypothetical protein
MFFFQFLSIEILEKFDPKIAKLVEFTLEKKFQKFSQLLWKKWRNFARKKKHWTAASRTRQVSTSEHEGDGEPREGLGQSAKRSSQTSAGCTRAESQDFLPARVCGRSRAESLLALLPSCACAILLIEF